MTAPDSTPPTEDALAKRREAFDTAIDALKAAVATYDLSGDNCGHCGRKSFTSVREFRDAQQVEATIKKLRKLCRGEED